MSDENRSSREMCVRWVFIFLVRLRNYAFSNTLLKIIAIPKFQVVYFHWKWCRYCRWKLTVIFGSVRILANRVNCPVPNRAEIRTANFQVQYLLQFYPWNLKITIKPFTGTLWMVWSWSSCSVHKIGANITLESWLFGFRPCSGQGQFTLPKL